MKLIVGLGNPGRDYEGTRHNIGFMVVDAIADGVSHTPWREDYKAELCSCTIAGEKVLLVKPQTFMNLSGESVGPLMRYYKLTPEDVYVIYDDMDLPVGKLRIRPNGSAGGHNGIKSMISHLGTDGFPTFSFWYWSTFAGVDRGRSCIITISRRTTGYSKERALRL